MAKERYNPKEAEAKWQEYWAQNKIYAFDENSKKPVYSIDTPPPYASAAHLHVGHGMHYSQFEFIARFQRMRGKNVFFPMGYDDNGLPTERYVEKKHKLNKNKISRADFIKLCLEETKIAGKNYFDLFSALGFSIDWSLLYQTIGPRARRVSQKSFIDLFKKDRLERNDYPTMWCVQCQTAIAQADLDNVDLKSHFNEITFKSGDRELVIATTRPELLPACVALFYNPDDKRYADLKGKKATVPIFGHEVPILADEAVAVDKGTGLMMVCTFGDKEDVDKWNRHKLDLRVVFTPYGTLNELAGEFSGLKIKDARKQILAKLKEGGDLVSQKEIEHAVNVHERCGTEVEFLKTQQWQIKLLDKKEELIAAGQQVKWHPDHMRVRYEHWVKNLQWNWIISRQRYFGVPFPVWYCKSCEAVALPDESDLPVDPREEQYKGPPCNCGSTEFVPEMDVMDTWMTSSVTPQINANWGADDERKDFVPMSMRPQAHDIIRTWAFYTIAKSHFHHGTIPWTDIMISGHGLDTKGMKISKSKGNFIGAPEVIEKYSADAFRFWAAGTKLGEDLAYQEKDVSTGQKLLNKLDNASKFVFMQLEGFDRSASPELTLIDRAVLSKLERVVQNALKSWESYDYSKPRAETELFFWQVFCDQYLEIVKDRFYNESRLGEKQSAQYGLYHALYTVVQLLAPIMPHITEHIYQTYFRDSRKELSIHVTSWPTKIASVDEDAEKVADVAFEIINLARKFKSEQKVSLRKPVSAKIRAPLSAEQFEELRADIVGTIRATSVQFDTGEHIDCEFELVSEESK